MNTPSYLLEVKSKIVNKHVKKRKFKRFLIGYYEDTKKNIQNNKILATHMSKNMLQTGLFVLKILDASNLKKDSDHHSFLIQVSNKTRSFFSILVTKMHFENILHMR